MEEAKQSDTFESIVPPIIEKVDEEENEMATNLRVGFRERQQKKLSEAIKVGLSTKMQKMGSEKASSSKLIVIPPTMSIHLFPHVLKVVDMESILFHELGETILS